MSALYIYLVLPILFVFFSIIKSISVVDETICLEILTEIAPSLFILNKYWLIFHEECSSTNLSFGPALPKIQKML